jgi:hypothetical protein
LVAAPEVVDWFCVAPWLIVEDEFTSVDCWLAVTEYSCSDLAGAPG